MSSTEEQVKLHKEKGNEYFKQQKYKEAVDEFTKCINLNENDHVLYSNRSGAYAQLSMYEESLKDAEKCILLKPDWPKGYSRKGLALFHLRRSEEAEKAYKKGLSLDPNNEALKEGLKNVLENRKCMTDMAALSAVMQAVRSNAKLREHSKDPNYIKQLVDILKQVQQNPSSLKMFLNQPDARIREGLLAALGVSVPEEEEEEEKQRKQREQQEKEKKKMEEEQLKKASQKSPEHIEADKCKEKGNELYKKRQFTEALEMYDKAIEIFPNDLTYNLNKAAVFIEQGEYDKCIEECEKAIERRYDVKADFSLVGKLFARMGVCYMKMKEYAKAMTMYEKSLLEDNCRQYRAALKEAEKCKIKAEEEAFINPEIAEEHRQKGNEFFKEGDFPAAKKEYDMAIRRNPRDAKLYSNRAAALTKLMEYPSALADTEKCLELDPAFVKGWSRKGNLHIALKEYNKAMQAFEQGLKLQPDNHECQEGKINVIMKIQQMNRSGDIDEEQYRHAMADPETQAILTDPQFNLILKKITENPASLQDYMQDPKIADGIQKLIMAGVLRTA